MQEGAFEWDDVRTDWARLRTMSDAEVIANALSDPDAQPLTEEETDEMGAVPDVKRLRLAMGLTQAAFAERFGLRLSVVRDWEQGRSAPGRVARVLLSVIAMDADVVARAARRLFEAS